VISLTNISTAYHQARNKPRHKVLRWMISLWLTGIIFLENLGDQISLTLLLVSFAWIIPWAWLTLGRHLTSAEVYKTRPATLRAMVAFLAVAVLSCAYSLNVSISMMYVVITCAGFILCGGLWHVMVGYEAQVLSRFAVLSTAGLSLIFLSTYSGVGRFDSIRNPNSIGLILFGVVAASLAIRAVLLRAVCLGACLYMLWSTQSRSAMIGTVLMLAVYLALTWRTLPRAAKWLSIFASLGLVAIAIANSSFWAGDLNTFVTTALRLSDPDRGINSNFTSRTELWRIALAGCKEHWLGGIGYRAHDWYPGLEMTAHNGYLALWLETGVFGVMAMFLLFYSGVRELIAQSRRGLQPAKIGLSLIAGYLFICLFERYLINFGTPTSILVLMFLLIPRRPNQGPYSPQYTFGFHARGKLDAQSCYRPQHTNSL
jgi:O-antigen ligase